MTTEHFNMLTEGEAERLAMLAEECAEVIKVIGKILRHGYDNSHPDYDNVPNRDFLTLEVTDVLAVIEMMNSDFAIIGDVDESIAKKLKYAHHQQ